MQKHINDFAKSTSADELQLYIGAIRHCANVYPPGSEFWLKDTTYRKISTSHGNCEASFKVATREGNVRLVLSLRKSFRRIQQPSLDGPYSQSLLGYNVALAFDVAESDIRQSDSCITMADEMRHVLGLIEAVDKRVLQTFSLESEHAFATTMAEALLRVVELRAPGLVLVQTRVTTYPDKEASQIAGSALPSTESVAVAKWESSPKHVLNLEQRKSRAVEVAIRQDAEREDDMEDAHDACEDELTDDEPANDTRLGVQTFRGEPGEIQKKTGPANTSSGTLLKNARRAYIALGSNVGDRLAAIEHACRTIDRSPDMRILRTSSLYETEPMYVENQDRFLNGACLVSTMIVQIDPHLLNVLQIETTLEPMELLDRLQAIEKDLGRIKLIDKGPRNIDLDILDYERLVLDTERLTLPHRSMMEREFVLRPLAE